MRGEIEKKRNKFLAVYCYMMDCTAAASSPLLLGVPNDKTAEQMNNPDVDRLKVTYFLNLLCV